MLTGNAMEVLLFDSCCKFPINLMLELIDPIMPKTNYEKLE